MTDIEEKNLVFSFSDEWDAVKYDRENGFYKQKINQIPKTKAVDIIALDNKDTIYLIEIKDFSLNEDSIDPVKLIDGISAKVFDTCGGLYSAKRAGNYELKPFADFLFPEEINDKKVVIVIHIDIRIKEKKKRDILLRKISIIYDKIRQKLSFMRFTHIVLTRTDSNESLNWKVRRKK